MVKFLLIIRIFAFITMPQQIGVKSNQNDVLHWNDTTYHLYPSMIRMDEYYRNFLLQYGITVDTNGENNMRYVCELEISNDTLYLMSISGINGYSDDSVMEKLFDAKPKRWMKEFSGVFYLGYGINEHQWGSSFTFHKKEVTMHVKDGICGKYVTNKSVESEYYGVEVLSDFIYSNLNLNGIDGLDENTKAYIKYDIDATGHLKNVVVMKSSGNEFFDKEAIRVVSLIPSQPIAYYMGDYYPKYSMVPVSYSYYKKLNGKK